jgi:hypothetical protein
MIVFVTWCGVHGRGARSHLDAGRGSRLELRSEIIVIQYPPSLKREAHASARAKRIRQKNRRTGNHRYPVKERDDEKWIRFSARIPL